MSYPPEETTYSAFTLMAISIPSLRSPSSVSDDHDLGDRCSPESSSIPKLRLPPNFVNGSRVQAAALLDYSLAGVTRITEFEGFKLLG
jgi:hypothetical protein